MIDFFPSALDFERIIQLVKRQSISKILCENILNLKLPNKYVSLRSLCSITLKYQDY